MQQVPGVSDIRNWLYIPKVRAVVDSGDRFYARCYYRRLLKQDDDVIKEANARVLDRILLPYGAANVRYVRFPDEYGIFVRINSAVHRRLIRLLKTIDELGVLSGEHLYRCKRRRSVRYIQRWLEYYNGDRFVPAGTAARGYQYCEQCDNLAVQYVYSADVYAPSVSLIEEYWLGLGVFSKTMKSLRQQRLFRIY